VPEGGRGKLGGHVWAAVAKNHSTLAASNGEIKCNK